MEKKHCKLGRSTKGAALFVILFSLSMHFSYAQQVNLGFLRDVSISSGAEFNSKQAFLNVIGMVDIKDAKVGLNLYTCVIGEPGIPRVNEAVLPKSEGRFTPPSVRRKSLSAFIRKGLVNFEALNQVCDDSRTEILRSLVALVDQFETGADRTILIVESDFISSGHVADFIKYKNRPSDLMRDFDKIISAFRKDGELPDLSGFEVVMRITGDSQLALWSARWWEKALYLFGASTVKMEAAF